jgi:hypothetical protein
VVGDVGDHDARGEEESCFQAECALVVQFPPVADDVFGDEHADGRMAIVTIQAPWLNFVIRTMIKTMAVKVAPVALIACERWIFVGELLDLPLVSSRCQCRTMPS